MYLQLADQKECNNLASARSKIGWLRMSAPHLPVHVTNHTFCNKALHIAKISSLKFQIFKNCRLQCYLQFFVIVRKFFRSPCRHFCQDHRSFSCNCSLNDVFHDVVCNSGPATCNKLLLTARHFVNILLPWGHYLTLWAKN